MCIYYVVYTQLYVYDQATCYAMMLFMFIIKKFVFFLDKSACYVYERNKYDVYFLCLFSKKNVFTYFYFCFIFTFLFNYTT